MSRQHAFSGRPELIQKIHEGYSSNGQWEKCIPFVYREEYNIRAYGLEKLHPFESCKFGKIVDILEKAGICQRTDFLSPLPSTDADLLDVHTEAYLQKLSSSKLYICQILESPTFFLMPKFLLTKFLINPVRYHTGGTIAAMALAIEHGWSINIGGGSHHARRDHGEGWCFFADITLGIRKIRRVTNNKIQKVMYIDCDVHQGNGVERDKLHFEDNDLFILDVYNYEIWPNDILAKNAIDISVGLTCKTEDGRYLSLLDAALKDAQKRFRPDLIVYNSGTDILQGDPLGFMNVSPNGVIKRDERVFQFAADIGVPITMVLSGGYAKQTHIVIADSILNLTQKFNLLQSDTGKDTSETRAS